MLNNGTLVLHINWIKVDIEMPFTAKYHREDNQMKSMQYVPADKKSSISAWKLT
jgi:hypothetical protein